MDQKIKEIWLTELRSGNRKQGTKKLRNGKEEFCCLGVLCDITKIGKWDEPLPENRNEHWWWYGFVSPDGQIYDGVLSEYMRHVVGITEAEMDHLIYMNDYGESFNEIADWIEVNL